MENIYLVGSEDVSRGGSNMASAAQDILRAANNIDSTFYQYRDFMNDWLNRFEQVLKDNKNNEPNKL
jgi:hypothetical protein